MPGFTHFEDDELQSRVITIKVSAGVHAAIRELTNKLKDEFNAPSLNAALAAALATLVIPKRRQLTQRTRDLMLLTDQLPRKGQR